MKETAIFMSVFNEGKYLCDSIDSVLSQTYRDFILFIYNDASTDNTKEILESYKDHDKIKIIHGEENLGAGSRCHNRLVQEINNITFKYIALCDGSDLYYPEKLEKQVKLANENDELGIVGCYYEHIDLNDNFIQTVKPLEIDDMSIKKMAYFSDRQSGAPSLYRLSVLKKVGFWDDRVLRCYDTDLHVRMMRHCKVQTIPEVLYGYRVDGAHSEDKVASWTDWFKRLRYKWYCEQIGIEWEPDYYLNNHFGS